MTPTGGWYNAPKYMVSLLKAWYGDAATADNDFAFDYLPKLAGDYSFQPMLLAMKDGKHARACSAWARTRPSAAQNAKLVREGAGEARLAGGARHLRDRDGGLLVRRAGGASTGRSRRPQIGTEVFLLPAAVTPEKDGSYTNTMRLVQCHDKAVDPPGDARSEARFVYHLGRRLKELYADSTLDRATGRSSALTWDYPTARARSPSRTSRRCWPRSTATPSPTASRSRATATLQGRRLDGLRLLDLQRHHARAGPEPRPRPRRAMTRAALGWGFAWPNNVRVLYNRASADPEGRPWSERKRYVWWDADAGTLDRPRHARLPADQSARLPAARRARRAWTRTPATQPFVMLAEGLGRLFVPKRPEGRAAADPLRAVRVAGRATRSTASRPNPGRHRPTRAATTATTTSATPRYPYVLTTYRLTEHHTAGAMSRWVPWLAELQPEGFAEIGTELAAAAGHRQRRLGRHLDRARRDRDARAGDRPAAAAARSAGGGVHQVGLPWHFGYRRPGTGAIANDLTPLVEDPDSCIHEAKAFTCAVQAGVASRLDPRSRKRAAPTAHRRERCELAATH